MTNTNTKDAKDTKKFFLEDSVLSSNENFIVSFVSFVFVP
jgi:hypothetical protein